MNQAEFQEHWERAATAEYEGYRTRPVADLLADIAAGRYGDYYQIWRVIGGTAALRDAAGPLLHVLRTEKAQVLRWHAATAVISLAQAHEFSVLELAKDGPAREVTLAALAQVIAARLAADGAT